MEALDVLIVLLGSNSPTVLTPESAEGSNNDTGPRGSTGDLPLETPLC